jgi:hypothetical protein
MHGMGYRILFERMMGIMSQDPIVVAVGLGVDQVFPHDI